MNSKHTIAIVAAIAIAAAAGYLAGTRQQPPPDLRRSTACWDCPRVRLYADNHASPKP